MYVRPQVEGKPLTLAVSGKLWRDALIMFDRESKSLWSQVLGEAVAGPLKGTSLEEVPSQLTTWGEWKKRHPDTLALVKPHLRGSNYADYYQDPNRIGVVGTKNPDPRLPAKALVFGLEVDGAYVAVPWQLLEKATILNVMTPERGIVLFSPPREEASVAYDRTVDGRTLNFVKAMTQDSLVMKDEATGSLWSWETGECIAGELQGERLVPISGMTVYWGVWAQFHPETAVVGAP